MATTQEPAEGRVLWLVVGGSVLVALTTPLNLVLLLMCWSLIAATAGPYAADNSGGLLVVLGGTVNVGLFLALCGLAHLVFRRSSARRRMVAVVVMLVLHLALWLGWSFAVLAGMAATGAWL